MRRLISHQTYSFTSNHNIHNYKNYSSLSYTPFHSSPPPLNPSDLSTRLTEIFTWAKKNKAQYYSFLAFPHSNSIAEKQQAFLSLDYQKQCLVRNVASEKLRIGDLLKGQADGSSFPNGGLRRTSEARGYFVWDWKSDVFIKRDNNVMYIPALLVNHHGEALDDKTTFRKAESFIEKQCTQLLAALNIKSKGIFIGLGLQQQFFIIPKQSYLKRLDLTQASRTLFSILPPNNQQLSRHYYSKLQPKIQHILSQSQHILLSMGIPTKTRHKQVAPNQYQFCSVFEDAGKAIDHNLIKMWILDQVAEKNGMKVLYHQKPFAGVNGSGKHMNWSVNFWDDMGKLRGLFQRGAVKDQVYLLFVLIKLKAILSNQELYMSTISVPGNELRLGGHQAPPRIFSTFLGQTLTHLLKSLSTSPTNLTTPPLTNLKQKISHLICNLPQQDTDRNRTSPYAYTSNRYQFRAVGSSQNCFFPMTVILTTIGKQMKDVREKLMKGVSLEKVLQDLVKETERVRFEGDGYSKQWQQQAKSRNLYINSSFTQNLPNIITHGQTLLTQGIYTQKQLQSKSLICQQQYIKIVLIEARTMLLMINKNIIPRLYKLIGSMPKGCVIDTVVQREKKVMEILGRILGEVEVLDRVGRGVYVDLQQGQSKDAKSNKQNHQDNDHSHGKQPTLIQAQKLRTRITKIGKIVQQALLYVEEDKRLPELYQIMGTL